LPNEWQPINERAKRQTIACVCGQTERTWRSFRIERSDHFAIFLHARDRLLIDLFDHIAFLRNSPEGSSTFVTTTPRTPGGTSSDCAQLRREGLHLHTRERRLVLANHLRPDFAAAIAAAAAAVAESAG